MLEKYESSRSCNRSEQINFHDFLTKLINELPHLLQSVQRLLIIGQESLQIVHRQTLMSFEQKLVNSFFYFARNNHESIILEDTSSGFLNIFRRFSCRIMEILIPFKQRAETSPVFKPMEQLIVLLQNSIKDLQDKTEFQKFISEACNGFSKLVLQNKKKIGKKQLVFESKNKIQPISGTSKILFSTNRQIRSRSYQIEPEYQRKLKKLMNGINARFKTLDCLELDYSYFRSSFFQAKNKTEFEQQFTQRNQIISHQIKQYQHGYKQYLHKKQKRRAQKNLQPMIMKKLIVEKSFSLDKNDKNLLNHSLLIQRKSSLMLNNWAFDKQKSSRFASKKYSLIQEAHFKNEVNEGKQYHLNKTKYDMKNIVIGDSKICLDPCVTIQKANIKNTLRQLEVNKKRMVRKEQRPIIKNLRQITTSSSPNK